MKIRANLCYILPIIIILCYSCSSNRPKIGFLLPHLNIKRYLIERDAFVAKVTELGGIPIFMSADNDEDKQMEQVKDIVSQGAEILVLDPVNRFTAAEIVRIAHKNGIKVISYDRLVANCDIDALITFDATAIGQQMATYMLNKKPSGNYVILGGDKSDINAVLINEAIEKTLEPSIKSGNIKILYKSFVEKYSLDDGQKELTTCLNLSQKIPDVVITSGDALAQGAINALINIDRNSEVLITGQNAELGALKNILSGKQALTIYKPIKKMAITTAEIAINLTKGNKTKHFFKNTIFNGSIQVPSMLMGIIPVDASNIRGTVIKDGLYTESEIFN